MQRNQAQNGRKARGGAKANNPPKPTTARRNGGQRQAIVRAPAAQNRSARNRPQRDSGHREKERVATIVGSVAFGNVANIAVNPGLAESFPWLSGVAQHYERYRMDSFTVRYKNLKGTDSDGNVIMSFDYDTLDPAPSSAVVQTQSTVYVDGAPWRIFEMKVPTDGTKKFIRAGGIAGADLKTYDFGRVFVSAEGCADTSDHGYLEFEYHVTLFEKQTAGASSVANRCYTSWNLSANTAALSASAVLDIDEPASVASSDVPTNVNGTITLGSAGFYRVYADVSWIGGGGVADSDSTVEIRVDGASQTPPVLMYASNPANGSSQGSLGCLVESDGTTTVDLYYNDGAGTHLFRQDACRLSVCAQ